MVRLPYSFMVEGNPNEVLIDVVDLVEEFPGEQVLAVAVARDEVAKPFLINRPRGRAGEERVLVRARSAVGRVVRILRPEIIAAEKVRLRFEHAMEIEA